MKYRDWIGDRVSFDREFYPFEGKIELFDRSLRAQTMQGPRVSIACSERCVNPSNVTFKIMTEAEVSKEILEAIFDRGLFKGVSQWANAQYGCFNYKIIAEE